MPDVRIDGDSRVLAPWRVSSDGAVDRAHSRRHELVCLGCGTTFRASRLDAWYCGTLCRQRAWRDARRHARQP